MFSDSGVGFRVEHLGLKMYDGSLKLHDVSVEG